MRTCILFFLIALINTHFFYKIAYADKYQNTQDLVQQKEERQQSIDNSIIGKKYWLYVTGNNWGHLEFSSNPVWSKKDRNNFYVLENTSFKVTDLISVPDPHFVSLGLSSSLTNFTYFYKIVFDDGKIAFLDKSNLQYSIVNCDAYIDEYVTTSNIKDTCHFAKDSLFEEDPALIKAKLEKYIADRTAMEKKAETEWKTRADVSLGMTKEQVLRSKWGKPTQVNRTKIKGLVHEQWVYGHSYLYFTNNILTAIQD